MNKIECKKEKKARVGILYSFFYRIAGAIRVPRRYWPLFVFIFFIFLVPDSSFLLNIMAAIAGLLCMCASLFLILQKL